VAVEVTALMLELLDSESSAPDAGHLHRVGADKTCQQLQARYIDSPALPCGVHLDHTAEELDLAGDDRYAAHSLRAGLATSAAAGGASERAIMNQTGHRSTDMVRRYIRAANLFAPDNAASLAGL
jgi:hypothetical protein